MKVSKQLERDIIRLQKLNYEASILDNKIRTVLEKRGYIDSGSGDGLNGFSMDSYIDICNYGNGDPQEIIDMLKSI